MHSNSFSKRDYITDFIEKTIISGEIKRRNFGSFIEVFNPSSITECDRRILYRSRGTKCETLTCFDKEKKILEDESQNFVKKKWLDFFDKSLTVQLLDKNVTVSDESMNLSGVVDGVLRIGDLQIILMVRSLNAQDFIHAKNNSAPRKHIVEIMLYMWLIEIHHGVLLYDNKNSNEFYLYHVVPYIPIIEAARKKCLQLFSYKISGKIPSRQYKSSNSKECSICEFSKTCWEKGEI